ncbi:MAG: hypothetical protein QM756_08450 [Polyangiaceae bacterium]
MHPLELERLADGGGNVRIGWVGEGILYAKYEAGLSAELGLRLASRLDALLAPCTTLRMFVDASTLKHYDLLARSAFVRTVLAHKSKFAALVVLKWDGVVSPASRTLVALLGEPSEFLNDGVDFQLQLFRAAPHAPQVLAQSSIGPVEPTSGAEAKAAAPRSFALGSVGFRH